MTRLTIDDVMELRPCQEYSRERVAALWAGRRSLSPLEILDLDIPIQDRFWCVLRPGVIGERTCRVLACDFAGHVLPIYEAHRPTDTRPRVAIETAIRYLDGLATDDELSAAGAAAWDASWDASWDAAWEAAWAAAGDAAWAAWYAEREWQLARAREVIAEEGGHE